MGQILTERKLLIWMVLALLYSLTSGRVKERKKLSAHFSPAPHHLGVHNVHAIIRFVFQYHWVLLSPWNSLGEDILLQVFCWMKWILTCYCLFVFFFLQEWNCFAPVLLPSSWRRAEAFISRLFTKVGNCCQINRYINKLSSSSSPASHLPAVSH